MSKKDETHSIEITLAVVGIFLAIFLASIAFMTAVYNASYSYLISFKPVNYACQDIYPRLKPDSPEYWDRYFDNKNVSLIVDRKKEEVWLDGRPASNAIFSDIHIEAVDAKIGKFSFDRVIDRLSFGDRSVSCRKLS